MLLSDFEVSNRFICGPFIIAHRGASFLAPENTITAIQKAIESGANFAELDVRLSKDGVPFVIHDASLERTTGNKGLVADHTKDQLEKMYASYPSKFGNAFPDEKLPSLMDALEFSRGKIKLCLELKTPDLELPVIELMEYFGMVEDTIIISSHSDRLRKIKRLNPASKVLYLQECISPWSVLKAFKNGFNYIASSNCAHERIIKFAHLYDIGIFRFSYPDRKEITRIIHSGVDGVITNNPDICQSIKAGEKIYV